MTKDLSEIRIVFTDKIVGKKNKEYTDKFMNNFFVKKYKIQCSKKFYSFLCDSEEKEDVIDELESFGCLVEGD
jgi:nitrogen regulatory protein PII-like uncharacterized protein